MTRHDAIRARLNRLEAAGAIRQWQAYRPAGLRWLVTGAGFIGERAYTTNEVECYLAGVETGLESCGMRLVALEA
jgi:hypothetical protein